MNGYKISRHDPLHRIVIGRVYHWFVKLAFSLAAARRGLRLPAHAPQRLREGPPHPLLRRHLRRAHEEGAGPRLPHRRGAGAPLPPQLRQEPVLQLPAGLPHPRRPRAALVGARRPQAAPPAGQRALGAGRPRERPPRLLPRPPGPRHRRPRLHRLEPLPHPRRPGRARDGGRQPAARLRGQPLQPRRLRGQGPHQHRRRARARDGVPGARPGGALQPGRPGEPHRLDERPRHRPRDQLHEPAADPGGGAARATPSSRSSTPARARSTASRSTCRWTRSTSCSRWT